MVGLSIRTGGQIVLLCLALLLAGPAAGAVDAHGAPHPAGLPAHTVLVTFRLEVTGSPAARTTFWVAYGPLAGRFGLIQLHSLGGGVYGAGRRLPMGGRTTYAYLAGQGVAHTRIGRAPGDPVIIIESFGPATALEAGRSVARWQAPVG